MIETAPAIDIRVENHGTVFLIRPISDAGSQWIDDNLQVESWQWLGEAVAVDHHYIMIHVIGMLEDGLSVDY